MMSKGLFWSVCALVATAVLSISAPSFSSATQNFPGFYDVAEKAGITSSNVAGGLEKDYILESTGNGAAFFDFDGDGDMDLLLVNGSTLHGYKTGGDPLVAIYENAGGRFTDVTGNSGITRKGWGSGVCVADYDNDGRQDFYITAYGPDALYRNAGNGVFTDQTSAAGISDSQWGMNCAFGDYDRDGDVDLYVANYVKFNEASIPIRGKSDKCSYRGARVFCGPQGLPGEPDTLYRNNGNGTFTDVSRHAGINDPGYYGFAVLFSDFDNDGWPDIYVANDGNPNLLFHNNRNGTFTEAGVRSGSALNEAGGAQSGMGASAADYDNDGLLDIIVTNYSGDRNTLYRNLGNLLFIDNTAPAGLGEASLPHLGWGVGILDLDNDGLRDIFVANGHVYPQMDGLAIGQSYAQPKEVYRNLGEGRFEEIVPRLAGDLAVPRPTRGAAFADFDNDGDLDVLAINMNARPNLYVNEGGNRKHWITFRLVGTRSNRDAIGARIEIVSGGRQQVAEVQSGGSYLSHNDMRVHFGLGTATRVEQVRIRWPNSGVEELAGLDSGRFLTIREGQGIVSDR